MSMSIAFAIQRLSCVNGYMLHNSFSTATNVHHLTQVHQVHQVHQVQQVEQVAQVQKVRTSQSYCHTFSIKTLKFVNDCFLLSSLMNTCGVADFLPGEEGEPGKNTQRTNYIQYSCVLILSVRVYTHIVSLSSLMNTCGVTLGCRSTR